MTWAALAVSAVAMAEPCWDARCRIAVTADDVLLGVAFVCCPNCGGVGLIPWSPEIEECVLCKGTGSYPVGV